MKKASKVLYIIAIVLNCFTFLACAGMFAAAFVMKRYPGSIANYAAEHGVDQLNTIEKVLDMVNPVIIAGVISLVLAIVLLVFGIRALKAIEKREQATAPHIVAIVLGAITEIAGLFYILGGIFALINASQTKQPAQPVAPPEENKPE